MKARAPILRLGCGALLALLFRASARVTLPKGEQRLLLRARTGSRLWIDGKLVLSTRFPNLNAAGHEEVPELPVAAAPDIRDLQPGQLESLTNFVSDGGSHTFMVEAVVGTKGRRPEPGGLSVSFAPGEGKSFPLVSPKRKLLLTEGGWAAFEQERRAFWTGQDKQRRALRLRRRNEVLDPPPRSRAPARKSRREKAHLKRERREVRASSPRLPH